MSYTIYLGNNPYQWNDVQVDRNINLLNNYYSYHLPLNHRPSLLEKISRAISHFFNWIAFKITFGNDLNATQFLHGISVILPGSHNPQMRQVALLLGMNRLSSRINFIPQHNFLYNSAPTAMFSPSYANPSPSYATTQPFVAPSPIIPGSGQVDYSRGIGTSIVYSHPTVNVPVVNQPSNLRSNYVDLNARGNAPANTMSRPVAPGSGQVDHGSRGSNLAAATVSRPVVPGSGQVDHFARGQSPSTAISAPIASIPVSATHIGSSSRTNAPTAITRPVEYGSRPNTLLNDPRSQRPLKPGSAKR